jgi:replicative DNA helicase
MTGRPCYRVVFDDETAIVADAEHGWLTDTHASRKSAAQAAANRDRGWVQRTVASVKTTREIAGSVRSRGDNRLNHAVVTAGPLILPDADLLLPPYVLGVWLGGGTTAAAHFTSADPEVAMLVEAEGIEAPKLTPRYRYGLGIPAARVPVTTRNCLHDHGSAQAVLRTLGVLGDKHIPARYLRASEPQRRALLAGLLDTDGTVTRTGSVQFGVTCRRLAEDFRELVLTLGYRCGWSEKRVKGRTPDSSISYTVTFTTDDEVFRLTRKRLDHKARQTRPVTPRTRRRYITAATPVPSVPVRCVQVDSPDHLYLASRSMVPTHNSTLALDFARAASIKNGLTAVLFSLEMSRNEITMRLLSAEARVPLHSMRTGQMGDEDWTRLARRMSEVVNAPLFIDDSPNMSMMEIRAKCRRLRQRNDLRLVIIDYLQLMTSPKRVENRQQEVSDMSRSLKLLAKELNVPVIAVAQLNRGPEQRTDKRPLLADLRESGSIEQDSDVVILLHREDAYERESPRAGEADFIVAKHRNGPTATVTVAFQGHYSRFVDMAVV